VFGQEIVIIVKRFQYHIGLVFVFQLEDVVLAKLFHVKEGYEEAPVVVGELNDEESLVNKHSFLKDY